MKFRLLKIGLSDFYAYKLYQTFNSETLVYSHSLVIEAFLYGEFVEIQTYNGTLIEMQSIINEIEKR